MSSPQGLWRAPGERPRVYGHRGTRGHASVRENTLEAFALALDQGADGIELDVRLCGSGEVIALHDPDLARVAPGLGEGAEAMVAAETTLGELQRAGVPTLEAVLSLALERDALVNVEVKPDVPDRDALLAAVVESLGRVDPRRRGQLLLSSFSKRICAGLSAVLPELPVLLLLRELPPDPAPTVAELLPGLVGVHPKHTLIDAYTIEALREGGRVVNAWTVNDADEALRLSELGVDGLITDDVPTLLAAFG